MHLKATESRGTTMTEAVRFQLEDGSTVLVEAADDDFGVERVSRATDGVVEATERLEQALGSVRDAAKASIEALRTLSPQKVELEFGVKLNAEAGASIARTAAEGHFVVKVTWAPEDNPQIG
jgi:Trypsin-co-occurring domain 1